MDHWPSIRVKRFRDESEGAYRSRKAEVVAIIEGFRRGRFSRDLGDKLDQRLDDLLTGLAHDSKPDPFGIVARAESVRRMPLQLVFDAGAA